MLPTQKSFPWHLSRTHPSQHPSLPIPVLYRGSRHTFSCYTYFPLYCLTSSLEYQLQLGRDQAYLTTAVSHQECLIIC